METPDMTVRAADVHDDGMDHAIKACPRKLSAGEVLDLHSDLHKFMTHLSPHDREMLEGYARYETAGFPVWQASHLHPATDMRDLSPWLRSLGSDLEDAPTYQVTAEMITLAEALRINTPNLGDIVIDDVPSESGFMWFDRPIPRPSVEDQPGQQPLLMHALSWQKVEGVHVRVHGAEGTAQVDGLRIREWGWTDDPHVHPYPLFLIGQSTALLYPGIHSPLPELELVHMLWVLMGMEITATERQQPARAARKRARDLKDTDVRVITLRRAKHSSAKPSATPRHIDWSCTWIVRKHDRHLERQDHHAVADSPGGPCKVCEGRTARVKAHLKGPDGMPLRSADILWKLSR